jgi:aspartate 1-decarboxylase
MRRTVLKSKIHRATVTDTDLNYEGSLTIDEDLLDAADMVPFEQIHVWDVTNGTRLVTYALPGVRGSGVIQVNGAGAHLIKKKDILIIATFTELKNRAAKKYKPTVVFVDAHNAVKDPLELPTGTELPLADVPTAADANGEGAPKSRKKKA